MEDPKLRMDAYYSVLGVDSETSPEDVSKSYRRLSLRAHPDKPGGSEAKFLELGRAHEVLKDAKKRKAYDHFGLDLGDDDDSNELCLELGNRCSRALGTALMRVAAVGAICVAMRYTWARFAFALACFCLAAWSRLPRQAHMAAAYLRISAYALGLPLGAWAAQACGAGWVYDVLVYSVACGAMEFFGPPRMIAIACGLLLRLTLGARAWMFIKLVAAAVALLALSHIFFVFLASLVHEIVDAKLTAYGMQVRAALAVAEARTAETATPEPPKDSKRR
ncbi:hypothetical protein M885DRAFT_526144 [Pelagophyceae sp. CCMP2097]|nr:hypothetical protein M885DRAFT_526144 [Pelagophyceae sp. CCMP2097]|mmetsp:Transcript_32527/g.109581  ORF Transcript_32527/g.109581 Transcript_32527/m.109581 type:complete len:278 (-) Transcript_32527:92-925(-)